MVLCHDKSQNKTKCETSNFFEWVMQPKIDTKNNLEEYKKDSISRTSSE